MNRRIRGPGGNKGDTALKLLERLGRKTEQGKPEVRENPIFAGRAADAREEEYQNLKVTVHRAIVDEMSAEQQRVLDSATHSRQEIENVISGYVQRVLEHNPFVVPRGERARLVSDICDEILGLGPIEPFLKDDSITEVMVNGPKKIYVERMGKLHLTGAQFHDNNHLMAIIDKIVTPIGRHVDEASPLVDARLQDGSRVNVVIPPLSLIGPCVTIRKFSRTPLSVENLISFGTLSEEMAIFLRACVNAKLNVMISGGTGSGKTTTLNVLSSFIPHDERIVTIEDAAELRLEQPHVVTLEARPANIEGKGAVTIRDLVKNSLRMRPDRIIVGEVRGGEALDMLQAMNTGHEGSLTTAHANSPRDVLSRLETMVLMSGLDLPVRAIRDQISSALDLIIHQERIQDGSRKITYITEVQKMEGDVIVLQDLFRYVQTGFDESGRALGEFRPTGLQPQFLSKFKSHNVEYPAFMQKARPGIDWEEGD
ncbi:MAG: CpaF family protein [Acidaminococcus fermentans]|nr:CpaF family protein [Acidaminococcus fermentans]MDD7196019.1 CpaF family protein [Acidaminococcus fermentans]